MTTTKKTETQEKEKNFPLELTLHGNRYFPEEYFNPNCIKRDIFSTEIIDLENLHIEGTHAEGMDFYGNITKQGIRKFNPYKTWEETIRFFPVYDYVSYGTPETIVCIKSNDFDNPVDYFLLEGDIV